jgi:hypothetical protein
MLWLLASEYEEGEITASMDEIAFRLHVSPSELHTALKPLIDSGFFIASDALAEPEQKAIPEKRREENIEKRTREEEEKEFRAASPSSEDFENLKKVYPRRKGNYAWKAAERKFNSLIKTGVDPKAIVTAASRLGESLRSKVGTEFIPMPASWLNSEDFVNIAVASFGPPAIPDKIPIEEAVQMYVRNGHWSRHAPVSDISQAPPELLAKHGLTPDGRRMQ